MKNTSTKTKKNKLASKVPTIKRLIDMDTAHPGTITSQQYTKKNGKKSKKYWLYQTSVMGKKICYRLSETEADEVKEHIASSKQKSSGGKKREKAEFKSYTKALEKIIKHNSKVRQANGDTIAAKNSSKGDK